MPVPIRLTNLHLVRDLKGGDVQAPGRKETQLAKDFTIRFAGLHSEGLQMLMNVRTLFCTT